MQRPARGIEIFWWCLQRWIYMWRPGGGMEICRAGTPWHVPASWICRLSQEEWNSDVSSPGFMRVRKSKSGKSGQVGTCQVWFLSKRGGSLATPLVPPPTPICSGILMRGQQIEKWLRLSLRLSKITNQASVCGLNVNQNGSYKHHQLCCFDDL